MPRYAIEIAYDGTKYAGWQRQPNAPTIAHTIEKALGILLKEEVHLTGAGRTDAGVHARQQVAHWDSRAALPSPFLPRLNALLPGDIRVLAVYQAQPTFHARHSAQMRIYRYFLRWVEDPFQRAYSLYIPKAPSIEILMQASTELVGSHDFSAFTKGVKDQQNPICHIFSAQWVSEKPGYLYFEITANRFLRAMVRALVGVQLRLAQGKLNWERFLAALHHQDRRWGMYLAPPQGLFLWRVDYPTDLLSLLEGYAALFGHATGAASGTAPESAPDSARPAAGSSY